MDLQEFRRRLAALGPDLADWPAEAADEAVALMAADVQAQDLFARAVSETSPDETADVSALVDRIVEQARRGE